MGKKSTYEFGSIDSAIEMLQMLKQKNKDAKVKICTIDFDNDTEECKTVSPDDGCLLVRRSESIIINEDYMIPHIQCFTHKQTDIKDIIKAGMMHDIFV